MKRNFAVFRSSALCDVKNVLLEDLAANELFIYRAQRSGFHRRAALLRADSDRTRPMRGVQCSESFWQPVQRTTQEAHVRSEERRVGKSLEPGAGRHPREKYQLLYKNTVRTAGFS